MVTRSFNVYPGRTYLKQKKYFSFFYYWMAPSSLDEEVLGNHMCMKPSLEYVITCCECFWVGSWSHLVYWCHTQCSSHQTIFHLSIVLIISWLKHLGANKNAYHGIDPTTTACVRNHTSTLSRHEVSQISQFWINHFAAGPWAEDYGVE